MHDTRVPKYDETRLKNSSLQRQFDRMEELISISIWEALMQQRKGTFRYTYLHKIICFERNSLVDFLDQQWL